MLQRPFQFVILSEGERPSRRTPKTKRAAAIANGHHNGCIERTDAAPQLGQIRKFLHGKHRPNVAGVLRLGRSPSLRMTVGGLVEKIRRAALLCCVLLLPLALFPQTRPTEYQVEAAYLYNFGKFVNFPVGSKTGGDFGVCILGEDPFGSTIDQTVANAKIDGKPIVTRRIARADEAQGCRIVFISESETGRLRTILPLLSKSGMLTVSDLPRFAERGGMIQFVKEGDRVRFEVNLGAAQQAGLNLSSELLKVAVKVTGGQRGQ